ncbi:MAG: beta strand repeat-containing protein, partial [Verrucomicrobiota bacterium]
TSTDVATFNTAAGTYGTSANPILIDTYRNISGLTFNGSVGNYTIGTTGGNALHMTSGGSILIGNGLTSNNTTITINAPILMYGGLTINNQAPNLTNKFLIGGNITSATASAKTLTLQSISANNANVSEITGLISNGSGTVSVTQSTSGGVWRLLNDANSFTGNLSIGGGTVGVSSIGDQGVASAAGAGTTINIGSTSSGANLSYLGGAATTNRTINMAGTTGNATIFQQGTGLLKLTSFTVTGAGNKTLFLRGTGAAGEIAGNIVDHSVGNRTALTKQDANTWTLSGTNTYSGNTTVSGGILTFANTASKSASSNVTAAAAGTVGLGVGGAGYYTASDVGTLFNTGNFTGISLNAASGVAIDTTNAGGTFDQSTALNAARTLTKLGTGTLVLSASNTLSNTTSSAGTLRVGNANALGSGTSALAVNAGTLDLTGNSVTVGVLSGTSSSAIVTSGVAGSVTLTSNTTSSSTYAGSIQDGSGKVGLTKSGNGGTLTLTGSSSYTGLTTVSGNGSVLSITDANALGASGTGNGTTVNTDARLNLSNNITLTESLTINGRGTTANTGALSSSGGNNTIASAITLGSASRIVVTSGTLTLSGGVTSSLGGLTIGTTGSNTTLNITSAIDVGSSVFNAYGSAATNATVVLGATGNNFSQVRTDTGGTIRTDVANAWNASANMTLGTGEASAFTNTFDLNGNSQTVAHLNSANDVSTGGKVTNIITSASASTLTMSGTATATYNCQITNAMALTKAGSNTQVLTGNNSYSGATTVNAGVLNIRDNNALGSTAGGTTVASGAALQIQGNITVTGEALSLSGQGISQSGARRSMSDNTTWAGDIAIGAANTRIASDTAGSLLTISGNISGGAGNSTLFQGNGNILVSGIISGGMTVATSSLSGANSVVTFSNDNNTYSGGTNINKGIVSVSSIKNYGEASALGRAFSGSVVMGQTTNSGTLLYTGTGDTSNRTFTIGTNGGTPSSGDTGGGTIQNDGSGALVFTATNFNTATTAAPGAGADRTLTLSGSNAGDNTISGVIQNNIVSGTATGTARIGLIKNGAGKWILGGNNTFTGSTTINQGTLEISGAGRLGGGSYAAGISNNGTFIYSGSGSTLQTLSGAITGTGSLTYNGSSTLSLAGTNTYSGGTTLAGSGLVAVSSSSVGSAGSPTSGAFGTGTVDLAGAQVRSTTGGSQTVANAVTISADTTFATIASEKSLTFTGPATLSGATRTLNVGIGSTVNTANLTFSGAIGDGGNGYGLTKNGTGTLILGGANTYTGITTVSAGTLAINGSVAGAVAVNSSATLQGSGSIGGALSVSGQLSPGNSIESIGASSVSFLNGSTYDYELDSSVLGGDLLYTTGALNIASTTTLSLTELASGTLAMNGKLTLISYGTWNGGLFTYNGNTLNNGDKFTLGSNEWLFKYDDTSGGNNFLSDQAGAS